MNTFSSINKEHKCIKGFSLIEIIIYIAILAVISVLVVETIVGASEVFGKARVKRALTLEGRSAMERMMREIRLATSVDTVGSVFGGHPGRLKLNTVVSSSDSTPTVREFLISGKNVVLREGSQDISLLSSASTTNLVFRYIQSGDTSEAIKIELGIEDGAGRNFIHANFYSTAVLRGSY